MPFSWRPLAVTLFLGGVDALLLAPRLGPDSEPWVAFGLVAFTMALIGTGLTAFEALVGLAGRRLRRVEHRVSLAGLAALGPALLFALVLTEGAGIQRSGWAPWVALIVVSGLVGAAACAPWVAMRLEERVRTRAYWAVALVVASLLLLALLSIYPIQYIRPHRGVLVVAMLLGLAAVWTSTPRAHAAGAMSVLGLVGLSLTGLSVALMDRDRVDQALYETYSSTLITQKLQGPLSRVLLDEVVGLEASPSLGELMGSAPPPPSTTPFPGRDVILFTGDTIRADRLLGPRVAEVAPNLAAWRAFRFPRAATTHTVTAGAFPSLLSGRWSSRSSEIANWGETFRRAGYETVAVFPLRPHFRYLDTFEYHHRWDTDCLDGLGLVKEALARVPEHKPLMLWMHSIDAHEPHRFRAEDARFGDGPIGTYDAAVHLFDRCFAEFRSLLREKGRWEKAIVAVTADHGESLGEDGRMLLHGGCSAEEVRIPLFISLPDSPPGASSVDFWFQSTDLLPTIASLVGATLASAPQGRDLSGVFSAPRPERKGWALTMGENGRCSSLVVENWQLVHDERGHFSALHDLDEPRGAATNVRKAHPDVHRDLDRARRELLRRTRPRPPATP